MDRPKSLLRLALAISLAGCRVGGSVEPEAPPLELQASTRSPAADAGAAPAAPSAETGAEPQVEPQVEPSAAPRADPTPATARDGSLEPIASEPPAQPAAAASGLPEAAAGGDQGTTAPAAGAPPTTEAPESGAPTLGNEASRRPEPEPSTDDPAQESARRDEPRRDAAQADAGATGESAPPREATTIDEATPAGEASSGTQEPDAPRSAPTGATGENEASPLAQGTAPETDEERALREEAARAFAARDYERAGKLTERLQALPSLSKARALHAQGLWREELEVLERALQKTPEEPGLLLAAGTVRMILVDAASTPETERRALLAAAREAFRRAQAPTAALAATPAAQVQALLGESRAARRLGEARSALDTARRAIAELALQRELRLSQEPAAEVVLAEAGLDVRRELAASEPAVAEALFTELVGALRLRTQEKSTDSLAHARLCELYLDAGRVEDAVKAAKRGLGASPGDAPLFELATRAARRLGGADEVLRLLREVREQFPNQPLVHWHLAREYFTASVDGVLLAECENETEQLTKAERWFRRARELDPRRDLECRGHEALTRALAGWRLVDEDRLREARIAFLSMNDVAPGAIAVDPAALDPRWAGRAKNGIEGLERIAAIHREKRAFVLAAEVGALIARELSSDPRRAREAAEAAKEAADGLAEESDALEQASRGEIKDPEKLKRLRKWAGVGRERDFGTDKERQKFQREALARRQSASEWYGRSWSQYLRAVELDPLDARLATDAARVAIRHTRQELARAGELLSGAVRIAEDRAGDPALKPDERNRLLVSWADAEQALGELELDVKDDPVAAARHFQKSLQVMPGPRPTVSETLLPRARARARERGLPDPAPDVPDAPGAADSPEAPGPPPAHGASAIQRKPESSGTAPRGGGSATGRPSRDNPF